MGRQSAELMLGTVMLLAETLDLRDGGTSRHSQTVRVYAREAAIALGLGPDRVQRIHAAGVLHDLGKLGIADAILFKPGPLDDAEWREMKRHPEIGAHPRTRWPVRHLVLDSRHRERIDGGGYPLGLSGEAIALEARILAVADACEAMIADRPYAPGCPSPTPAPSCAAVRAASSTRRWCSPSWTRLKPRSRASSPAA